MGGWAYITLFLITLHPFQHLNSSQALKITLRHVPACPASQRKRGKKLKFCLSEHQGLADLLGLSVQRIKKAEILGRKKKEESASISMEANLMGC